MFKLLEGFEISKLGYIVVRQYKGMQVWNGEVNGRRYVLYPVVRKEECVEAFEER
jgi:hypothetical protein